MNKKLFMAIRLLLIAVFVFAAYGINANSSFSIIMKYTDAELTIAGPARV